MPIIVIDSLSTQQRILFIQTYNENGLNIKTTFRKLRTSFGRHGRPTEPGIRWIVNRFEETGSVEGRRPYQHARPARTLDKVVAVKVCEKSQAPQLGAVRNNWALLRQLYAGF